MSITTGQWSLQCSKPEGTLTAYAPHSLLALKHRTGKAAIG